MNQAPPVLVEFSRPAARAPGWYYFGVTSFICLLKSIILVHGGAWYGRLSSPPVYDDATYFVDALERTRVLLDAGVLGFIDGLIVRPPHAPYSTFAAMFGFLLSGPVLAAPYVVNGLVIGLFVGLLLYMFQAGRWTTCGIAIVVVATPWFDYCVTIFHPDLVAGFGAACVAVMLVWQNETAFSPKRALLVGGVAAIALLMKPVAVGMVAALWGLAWLAGAALSYREERSIRAIATRVAFGAIPVLIIAGPYYIKQLKSIIAYIYGGFVTQAPTWSQRLAPSEHDYYYVNQARVFFGHFLLPTVIAAVAIIAAGFFRRFRGTSFRFGALVALALFSYLVPASVEIKHPYYGGVFYGCIAAIMILAIHFLVDRVQVLVPPQSNSGRARIWAGGAAQRALLTLVVLAALILMSDNQMRFGPQQNAQALYDGIYRLVRNVAKADSPPKTLVVYFASPAPIAPHAFRLRGLTENLDLRVTMSVHEHELKPLIDAASAASVVIIPDDEAAKRSYPFPALKQLPGLRAWLAENTRLKLVGTARSEIGSVEVYSDREVRN